jgi:hypothetical protein
MPRTIPDRSPIGDVFPGAVIQLGQQQALALPPVPGVEIINTGPLTVRYGVRYLEKPHISIVPGLLVLDYGAGLR